MLPWPSRLAPPLRAPNIPLAWLPHPALSHIYWIKPSPSLSIASHPLSHPHGYIPSEAISLLLAHECVELKPLFGGLGVKML